jgi:HK97 family phage major capsid protein
MQHRRAAKWIFHRDGVKMISKLKDGNGQYLWQPGLRAGDPDTILGLSVYESEYVPNTFTSGLYVGMLADFKWYYIADALDIEIQRLEEIKAETNQIEFIGRLKNDAMPVLEEAFVRVTLA